MTPEQRQELDWSEHAVIAALVRDNANAHMVDLKPEEFTVMVNSQIYGMLRELLANGFPVEPVGLAEALEARYNKDFAPLIDSIVHGAIGISNMAAHADVIRRRAQSITAKTIGARLSLSGDVSEAMRDLQSLSISEERFLHDHKSLIESTIRDLRDGIQPGVPTGYSRYDARFGGMHPGDLTVIAARPAVGKTALMLNILFNCKVPTLVISGEQAAKQCQARLLSSVGRVPFERIRSGKLEDADWPRIMLAKSKLEEVPYWVFEKASPSLADVQREARRAHHDHGIKLVMVDYLQRMKREGDRPRHEQVGDAIQGLKELARDLDIPVVCLAQVNREVDKREVKMPTMADLKDSGTIEQEADVIVMMYRERAYTPNASSRAAELYVAKNRHGPTGSIDLVYVEEYLRFENMERNDYGQN